ncbi:hypothetical protein CDD82_7034 [Ophiocordyceps australis]|uniref:Ubiquitin 3 binding protein But2 C-terminal domain-containing protein n=1 Tax=Ophiocordyceps australis TaxID=1399860 RepID=A0A2C5XXI3_9HYPO|nr:hypothetical protein CDD82_7034 [Ophiocordyceps australis]
MRSPTCFCLALSACFLSTAALPASHARDAYIEAPPKPQYSVVSLEPGQGDDGSAQDKADKSHDATHITTVVKTVVVTQGVTVTQTALNGHPSNPNPSIVSIVDMLKDDSTQTLHVQETTSFTFSTSSCFFSDGTYICRSTSTWSSSSGPALFTKWPKSHDIPQSLTTATPSASQFMSLEVSLSTQYDLQGTPTLTTMVWPSEFPGKPPPNRTLPPPLAALGVDLAPPPMSRDLSQADTDRTHKLQETLPLTHQSFAATRLTSASTTFQTLTSSSPLVAAWSTWRTVSPAWNKTVVLQ